MSHLMPQVYSGDLMLTPSTSDPSKTLFTYTATIVAKDPSLTAQFNDAIVSDFNANRIPFLAVCLCFEGL